MPNSWNNSGDSAARLEALRTEIDAVDEALHDLVMRRAALTEHMGALKSQGGPGAAEPRNAENPIRPAREAAILRRLAARHSGVLPFEVVVRIWRELIAANLRRQCNFELAIMDVGGGRLWDVAHAAFGALTRATAYFRAQDAIRAAWDTPGTLAVLPAPSSAAPELRIWPELLTAEGAPRIVSALPPLKQETWPEAFVVARAPCEPSGDDISFVLLTGRTPPVPDTAELSEAGFEGHVLGTWPAMSMLGLFCTFAAVREFVRPRDARLERLDRLRRDNGGTAMLVGAAPAPVRLPDE